MSKSAKIHYDRFHWNIEENGSLQDSSNAYVLLRFNSGTKSNE